MAKILIVAPHRPDRSPSQRYRIEQFMDYWEGKGYTFEYAWLIDEGDDAYFYAPGNWLAKGRIFLKSFSRRWVHTRKAANYDLVFIQREAFMTGSTLFERKLKASGAKVIFDFDDAIWEMDVSEGNKRLKWLKNPGKTANLVAMADLVIAGNDYLADYARHHNSKVELIPTVIDTDKYIPDYSKEGSKIIIGWTGSHTTTAHLRLAIPVLKKIQEKYGDRIGIKVISDRDFSEPGLEIQSVIWSSVNEVEDLQDIHIGIMPMPDNKWSLGKCGFKGLQYMALGKAVVLANVGANKTIVNEGVNGFLAYTDEEWFEKLCTLIDDAQLRRKLGENARKTIEDKYSVKAWRDYYIRLFEQLIKK